MHIRIHFNQRIFGGAKNPEQFDARSLEAHIVLAIGEDHFAPVHNALHSNVALACIYQMIDKIGIIDAIHEYGRMPSARCLKISRSI